MIGPKNLLTEQFIPRYSGYIITPLDTRFFFWSTADDVERRQLQQRRQQQRYEQRQEHGEHDGRARRAAVLIAAVVVVLRPATTARGHRQRRLPVGGRHRSGPRRPPAQQRRVASGSRRRHHHRGLRRRPTAVAMSVACQPVERRQRISRRPRTGKLPTTIFDVNDVIRCDSFDANRPTSIGANKSGGRSIAHQNSIQLPQNIHFLINLIAAIYGYKQTC